MIGGEESTKKEFVQAKMPEKKFLASRDGRKNILAEAD